MKAKKTALKVVSPNPSLTKADLATRTINLRGTDYRLSLDMASMGRGEREINKTCKPGEPRKVSVLQALLDRGSLLSLRTFLACALYEHQPQIAYEDAVELLDADSTVPFAALLMEFWEIKKGTAPQEAA